MLKLKFVILFIIMTTNLSAKDFEIKEIIHVQSPFVGNIYPMFMLNDENNNQLLVLDYFNSAIISFDLKNNIISNIKQIDDKIKYYFIPKDDIVWEDLNKRKNGLFLITSIFQDFYTKQCFAGAITILKNNDTTLGKTTIYANINDKTYNIISEFVKEGIYPRGANIAMYREKLVFQGIRGNNWSDFLMLYDRSNHQEKLLLSSDELSKYLKNEKIDDTSAGWCYFIDSTNILYYRFPDIPPIIINLISKKIDFVKLTGIANKSIFCYKNTNYIINDTAKYYVVDYKFKDNSIISVIYNKNEQNKSLDSIFIQLYDKKSLELNIEIMFKCPEPDIKHFSYIAGKDDKEYYLTLVNKSMDIYIYKLTLFDK